MSDECRRTDATQLLERCAQGDAEAGERLWPLVYEDLRGIARRHLQRERSGHTLNPTALVHEAWLRIDPRHAAAARDRAAYFALASRVMRSILVDHARRRTASKRDAGRERESLTRADHALAAQAAPEARLDVLETNEALERLARVDPELGQIAEWILFGGLSVRETAETMGVKQRTLERRWRAASAWLPRDDAVVVGPARDDVPWHTRGSADRNPAFVAAFRAALAPRSWR